jgi:hypothetical protein
MFRASCPFGYSQSGLAKIFLRMEIDRQNDEKSASAKALCHCRWPT